MPKVVTSCADIGFIYKFQFIGKPAAQNAVGYGFGLLVFFDRYESTCFRNRVERKPTSKPRGPRKKKQTP